MPAFPFDIVGFDLDGTLLDTSPDLAAAVNHALQAAGRAPLSPPELAAMIGGGAKVMLERALARSGGCEPAEFKRLYTMLLAYYGDHLADQTRPFPGMTAALDALAGQGVALAIVTNKFKRFATRLLGLLDLSDRFACVIGGDTLGKGNAKPSPLPIREMIRRCGGGRAAFVGDSLFDIAAGRAAGVATIAVSFGFSAQPATTLGADAVIDSFAELLPALWRLGGSLPPFDEEMARQ